MMDIDKIVSEAEAWLKTFDGLVKFKDRYTQAIIRSLLDAVKELQHKRASLKAIISEKNNALIELQVSKDEQLAAKDKEIEELRERATKWRESSEHWFKVARQNELTR